MIHPSVRGKIEAMLRGEQADVRAQTPGTAVYASSAYAVTLLDDVLEVFDEHDAAERAERKQHYDGVENQYSVGGM